MVPSRPSTPLYPRFRIADISLELHQWRLLPGQEQQLLVRVRERQKQDDQGMD